MYDDKSTEAIKARIEEVEDLIDEFRSRGEPQMAVPHAEELQDLKSVLDDRRRY